MNKLVLVFLAVCFVSIYAESSEEETDRHHDGFKSPSYLAELERKATEFTASINRQQGIRRSSGGVKKESNEIINNLKKEFAELKRRSSTRN